MALYHLEETVKVMEEIKPAEKPAEKRKENFEKEIDSLHGCGLVLSCCFE